MTVFDNNLSALSLRAPDLAQRVMAVGRFDKPMAPDAYAEEALPDSAGDILASSRLAVLLGIGVGVMLRNVYSMSDEDVSILLIELDINDFAKAISLTDLAGVIADERVTISVGEEAQEAVTMRLELIFGVFPLTDFPVFANRLSLQKKRVYYSSVADRLEHMKKIGAQNIVTVKEMEPVWRRNFVSNLPAILGSAPVSSLFGKYKNIPAVLVAAGPSLDRNAHLLSAFKGRSLIMAVDTSVRALLSLGITPDIVASLDAKPENFLHLAGLSMPDTLMVCNPMVNSGIVRESAGPVVFTGAYDSLFDWIEESIGERGEILLGGSVAASAFDLACKMGCSPIIFMGQDLCYHPGRSHASLTFYEDLRSGQGEECVEDRELEKDFTEDALESVNITGAKVTVTPKLSNLKRWFEFMITKTDSSVINSTEGGMLIEGAENLSMTESVARFAATCEDVRIGAFAAHDVGEKAERLSEKLKVALKEGRFIKSVCARAISTVKSAADKLLDPAIHDKNLGEELKNLANFSHQILDKKLFVDTNRFAVDIALDSVKATQVMSKGKKGNEALVIALESYRLLFTNLYDTAARYERNLNDSIKILRPMLRGAQG